MRTYTIKITGSGTAAHIATRLLEIAGQLHNEVNSGGENIEMEAEDDILFTEITQEPPDETAMYRVKLSHPDPQGADGHYVNGYLAWEGVIQEYELPSARRKAKLFNGKIERVQP